MSRTPHRTKVRLNDLVGRIVENRVDLETRGGDHFPAGTRFVVTGWWRSRIDLAVWNGKPPAREKNHKGRWSVDHDCRTPRTIHKVSPYDVRAVEQGEPRDAD